MQRPRRFCICVSNLVSSIAIAILAIILRIISLVLVTMLFRANTSNKMQIFFIVAVTILSIYILVDFLLLLGIYKKIKGLLYFWIVMAVLWLSLMLVKLFMDFASPGISSLFSPKQIINSGSMYFKKVLHKAFLIEVDS